MTDPEAVEVRQSPRFARRNTAAIRQLLYEKYGGACAFCGISDVPLEIAFIIPLARGGTNDLENFILLCPNCHRRMDIYAPREMEFVNYLTSLLRSNSNYRNVTSESLIDTTRTFQADISAEQRVTTGWQGIVVECKNYPAFSEPRLTSAIEQLEEYRQYIGNRKLILSFPGRLSEADKEKLASNNIEMWDIEYLATTFHEQIEKTEHPYFQPLLTSVLLTKAFDYGMRFSNELKACEPGQENWGVYQKLIERILEHLFCPPLRSPISERRDLAGANRRDIILPNYTPDGFWRFLRDAYAADYVLVDAKNYKGKIKKNAALQMANYLKPHGVGLFGFIVCRIGSDAACNQTLREQWMVHNKMVLVFNDRDIEAMLLAKSSGGNPEDLISQKLEDFRLSM